MRTCRLETDVAQSTLDGCQCSARRVYVRDTGYVACCLLLVADVNIVELKDG